MSIFFRAQSTYTQTEAPHAHAGIIVGQLINSSIDMDINTNFSQLTTLGNRACTGAVGYYYSTCHSCDYFLKAQTNFNNISIISKGSASVSGSTLGAIYEFRHVYNKDIRPVNKISSKINTITIHASGRNSAIGTCIGLAYSLANIINLSVNDAYIIGDNTYAEVS